MGAQHQYVGKIGVVRDAVLRLSSPLRQITGCTFPYARDFGFRFLDQRGQAARVPATHMRIVQKAHADPAQRRPSIRIAKAAEIAILANRTQKRQRRAGLHVRHVIDTQFAGTPGVIGCNSSRCGPFLFFAPWVGHNFYVMFFNRLTYDSGKRQIFIDT